MAKSKIELLVEEQYTFTLWPPTRGVKKRKSTRLEICDYLVAYVSDNRTDDLPRPVFPFVPMYDRLQDVIRYLTTGPFNLSDSVLIGCDVDLGAQLYPKIQEYAIAATNTIQLICQNNLHEIQRHYQYPSNHWQKQRRSSAGSQKKIKISFYNPNTNNLHSKLISESDLQDSVFQFICEDVKSREQNSLFLNHLQCPPTYPMVFTIADFLTNKYASKQGCFLIDVKCSVGEILYPKREDNAFDFNEKLSNYSIFLKQRYGFHNTICYSYQSTQQQNVTLSSTRPQVKKRASIVT